MDRQLLLESKTELTGGRVRLMFASDTHHAHADTILERNVTIAELQADFIVGQSYQLEQILSK